MVIERYNAQKQYNNGFYGLRFPMPVSKRLNAHAPMKTVSMPPSALRGFWRLASNVYSYVTYGAERQ